MANIELNADITVETQKILDAIAQLDITELESFHHSIGMLIAHRKNKGSKLNTTKQTQQHAIKEDSLEKEPLQEETDSNLPIVDALMPKSITRDGSTLF